MKRTLRGLVPRSLGRPAWGSIGYAVVARAAAGDGRQQGGSGVDCPGAGTGV